MTIIEIEITFFPHADPHATQSVISPEDTHVDRMEAEDAIGLMLQMLQSGGELTIHRNTRNPEIATYTTRKVEV